MKEGQYPALKFASSINLQSPPGGNASLGRDLEWTRNGLHYYAIFVLL